MDFPRQTGGVGEEVPDGHRTGLGVAVFDVEPREVGRDLIIQSKRTGIPGAEHADRGEEFRVGSDAEIPSSRIVVSGSKEAYPYAFSQTRS